MLINTLQTTCYYGLETQPILITPCGFEFGRIVAETGAFLISDLRAVLKLQADLLGFWVLGSSPALEVDEQLLPTAGHSAPTERFVVELASVSPASYSARERFPHPVRPALPACPHDRQRR